MHPAWMVLLVALAASGPSSGPAETPRSHRQRAVRRDPMLCVVVAAGLQFPQFAADSCLLYYATDSAIEREPAQ